MGKLQILIQVLTTGNATRGAGVVIVAACAAHSVGLAWFSHPRTPPNEDADGRHRVAGATRRRSSSNTRPRDGSRDTLSGSVRDASSPRKGLCLPEQF